jgi:vancomycin permeability regulator SanA
MHVRYLLAIILGAAAAFGATLTISSPIATWVVAKFTFESPDQVSNMHDAVFMGSNLVALLVGFAVGWAVGVKIEGRDDPA